jgi:hypothetical protein
LLKFDSTLLSVCIAFFAACAGFEAVAVFEFPDAVFDVVGGAIVLVPVFPDCAVPPEVTGGALDVFEPVPADPPRSVGRTGGVGTGVGGAVGVGVLEGVAVGVGVFEGVGVGVVGGVVFAGSAGADAGGNRSETIELGSFTISAIALPAL